MAHLGNPKWKYPKYAKKTLGSGGGGGGGEGAKKGTVG